MEMLQAWDRRTVISPGSSTAILTSIGFPDSVDEHEVRNRRPQRPVLGANGRHVPMAAQYGPQLLVGGRPDDRDVAPAIVARRSDRIPRQFVIDVRNKNTASQKNDNVK